jgi:hypothetical protein
MRLEYKSNQKHAIVWKWKSLSSLRMRSIADLESDSKVIVRKLMTVIYMMFLVLFIISLVLVLDHLQGKNLKK